MPVLDGAEHSDESLLLEKHVTDQTIFQTTITVREHSSNTSSEHKFPGFFAADSPADLDEEPKVRTLK